MFSFSFSFSSSFAIPPPRDRVVVEARAEVAHVLYTALTVDIVERERPRGQRVEGDDRPTWCAAGQLVFKKKSDRENVRGCHARSFTRRILLHLKWGGGPPAVQLLKAGLAESVKSRGKCLTFSLIHENLRSW